METFVLERIAMHPFFRNLTVVPVPAHRGQAAFKQAEKRLFTASGDTYPIYISEVFNEAYVPDLTYTVGVADRHVRLVFHFDRASKNCLCLEAHTGIAEYASSAMREQGKCPEDLDDLFAGILKDLRPVYSLEGLIAVGNAARQKLAL